MNHYRDAEPCLLQRPALQRVDQLRVRSTSRARNTRGLIAAMGIRWPRHLANAIGVERGQLCHVKFEFVTKNRALIFPDATDLHQLLRQLQPRQQVVQPLLNRQRGVS